MMATRGTAHEVTGRQALEYAGGHYLKRMDVYNQARPWRKTHHDQRFEGAKSLWFVQCEDAEKC